jgi:hypothetical protein
MHQETFQLSIIKNTQSYYTNVLMTSLDVEYVLNTADNIKTDKIL